MFHCVLVLDIIIKCLLISLLHSLIGKNSFDWRKIFINCNRKPDIIIILFEELAIYYKQYIRLYGIILKRVLNNCLAAFCYWLLIYRKKEQNLSCDLIALFAPDTDNFHKSQLKTLIRRTDLQNTSLTDIL